MQDKSYLVYWTRAYILIIGENLNTEVHKHHAYQISYKLDDDMVIRCADHSHSGDVIMFNKKMCSINLFQMVYQLCYLLTPSLDLQRF